MPCRYVSCSTALHRDTSVLFVCCTVQVVLWRLESTLSALPPLSQIQQWLLEALTLDVSLGQLFSLSFFNTVFSSQMEGLGTWHLSSVLIAGASLGFLRQGL